MVEDVSRGRGVDNAEETMTIRQIRLAYYFLKKIKFRELRAQARMTIEELVRSLNST